MVYKVESNVVDLVKRIDRALTSNTDKYLHPEGTGAQVKKRRAELSSFGGEVDKRNLLSTDIRRFKDDNAVVQAAYELALEKQAAGKKDPFRILKFTAQAVRDARLDFRGKEIADVDFTKMAEKDLMYIIKVDPKTTFTNCTFKNMERFMLVSHMENCQGVDPVELHKQRVVSVAENAGLGISRRILENGFVTPEEVAAKKQEMEASKKEHARRYPTFAERAKARDIMAEIAARREPRSLPANVDDRTLFGLTKMILAATPKFDGKAELTDLPALVAASSFGKVGFTADNDIAIRMKLTNRMLSKDQAVALANAVGIAEMPPHDEDFKEALKGPKEVNEKLSIGGIFAVRCIQQLSGGLSVPNSAKAFLSEMHKQELITHSDFATIHVTARTITVGDTTIVSLSNRFGRSSGGRD